MGRRPENPKPGPGCPESDSAAGAARRAQAGPKPERAALTQVSGPLRPDSYGQFAYAANYPSGTISAYTINPTTGALTVVAGTNPEAIAVDPTGQCACVASYDANNVLVYTINATTGALTAAGTAIAGAGS